MNHNVEAIYDQGVFRPIEPVRLPDGCRVHLRVEEQPDSAEREALKDEREALPLLERMQDFVGAIDDLPEDSSIQLDHYLYGMPKR